LRDESLLRFTRFTVISSGASRRLFFPPCSCEVVGLRREKSLFAFPISSF
jgi:hypothetical protein